MARTLFLRRDPGRGRWVERGAVPLLLGLLAAGPPESAPVLLPSGPVRVEGRVCDAPRARRSRGPGATTELGFRLDRVRVGGRTVAGTLHVGLGGDVALGRGDRVRVEGRSTAPGRLWVPHTRHLTVLHPSPIGGLDRARRLLRRRAADRLPRRAAAWASALALGERGGLPTATVQQFRAIGQGHLLAISGLHVGLWIAIVRALGRRLPGPGVVRLGRRRVVTVLGALALLAYAGLAGGDPPVLRATVFATLALLATGPSGRPRLPELLALAAVGLGAATAAGGDPGFWLSFSAVAGIAIVSAGDRSHHGDDRDDGGARRGRRSAPLRALRIATAAWLGAHVVLTTLTPDIVPWGPLLSLLLAPWLAAMLALSCLALFPGAEVIAGPLLEWCALLGEACARICDRLPGTPAMLPPVPVPAASLACLAALAGLGGARRTAIALVAATLAVVGFVPPDRTSRIVLPDLGRGQATLVLTAETTVLLDAGSVDRAEGGARAIRRALHRAGRARIDLVVLSHPHADHVLAIPGLVGRVPVGTVVHGPRFEEEPLGAAIARRIDRAGVARRSVSAGAVLRVGDLELVCLHPPARRPGTQVPTVNDDSLVVRVTGAGHDLLAPGDLEAAGLAECPVAGPVGVLLLPHHGRETPGLATWVDRVAPRLAITSGAAPPPSPVLRALVAAGSRWAGPVPGGVRVLPAEP